MYVLFGGLGNTPYLHVHVLRAEIYVALNSQGKEEMLRFLGTDKVVFPFPC